MNFERVVLEGSIIKKKGDYSGYELFPYFTYRSGTLLDYKGDSITNTCGISCPEARRSDDRTEKRLIKGSRDWILVEPEGSRYLDTGITRPAPGILGNPGEYKGLYRQSIFCNR